MTIEEVSAGFYEIVAASASLGSLQLRTADPEQGLDRLRAEATAKSGSEDLIELPLLFVDRDGEVTRFDSIERAEGYIEAIDVKANEYRAYDAIGRRLILRFEDAENRSWWRRVKNLRDAGRVKIGGVGEAAPDELRSALIAGGAWYGESQAVLETLSLRDLVRGIKTR